MCPSTIVQIAGNALALGDLGQMLDFVVGDSQLLFLRNGDGAIVVAEAYQDDQQQHRTPEA